MTGKIFVISIALTALLICGCSGSSETAKVANSPGPGSNVGAANTKVNTAPVTQANQPVQNSNVQSGSFVERSGQKRIGDAPANGSLPPPQYSEAPEDSTMTTSMNTQGQVFEIRVFKSHPQLAKVEATWIGVNEKDLKVFLRDGTMREVNTDQIANLKSANAAEFLALVGIHLDRPAAGDKNRPGAKNPR